jgi:inosine-uridine nucleoside N-ribohydrolase
LYYCDGLAAAIAVDETSILSAEKRHAEVELGGQFSRGGIFYYSKFV